jgi:enoyl-CoA hydratase/carnithine racemase
LSEHIITELTDGILRIEIRRPEKKNAFSMEMYRAMADAIERSDRESTIRVVLLHGQPPNCHVHASIKRGAKARDCCR